MVVNHQQDGWMWQVNTCSQSSSGVMTGWLANCAFRYWGNTHEGLYFLQIPSCFSPSSDLSFLHLKDNLHKILRLLFGTPLMFTKLCSSPSAPDAAHFRPRDPPLPSHQCPPLQAHIPAYQMLFCIWCKQLFEQSQRKCFMVNSWTFSVTCSCGFGSFFVRPAEMNCPVDLSDVSYKPLSPAFSG